MNTKDIQDIDIESNQLEKKTKVKTKKEIIDELTASRMRANLQRRKEFLNNNINIQCEEKE